MPNKVRLLSRCAAVALAAILIVAAYAFLSVWRSEDRAARLLRASKSLVPGTSGFGEVATVAKRFGAESVGGCSQAHCKFRFVVDNATLSWWGWSRSTSLAIWFVVVDGRLSKSTFYFRMDPGLACTEAAVEEKLHWPANYTRPVTVFHRVSGDTAGEYLWRCYVALWQDAPAATRARYLSFNVLCLSKFKGCRDAQELLPTVDW